MEKIDLKDSLYEFLQQYKIDKPSKRISILIDYDNHITDSRINYISTPISRMMYNFFLDNRDETTPTMYNFYKNIIDTFLKFDEVYIITDINVTEYGYGEKKFNCTYYSLVNNEEILEWLF